MEKMMSKVGKVEKIVHKSKHPYTGKVSQKTEYKLFVDGKEVHYSRNGRPFRNISQYKRYAEDAFGITEFEK